MECLRAGRTLQPRDKGKKDYRQDFSLCNASKYTIFSPLSHSKYPSPQIRLFFLEKTH